MSLQARNIRKVKSFCTTVYLQPTLNSTCFYFTAEYRIDNFLAIESTTPTSQNSEEKSRGSLVNAIVFREAQYMSSKKNPMFYGRCFNPLPVLTFNPFSVCNLESLMLAPNYVSMPFAPTAPSPSCTLPEDKRNRIIALRIKGNRRRSFPPLLK